MQRGDSDSSRQTSRCREAAAGLVIPLDLVVACESIGPAFLRVQLILCRFVAFTELILDRVAKV